MSVFLIMKASVRSAVSYYVLHFLNASAIFLAMCLLMRAFPSYSYFGGFFNKLFYNLWNSRKWVWMPLLHLCLRAQQNNSNTSAVNVLMRDPCRQHSDELDEVMQATDMTMHHAAKQSHLIESIFKHLATLSYLAGAGVD
jgi:hypothetical protein